MDKKKLFALVDAQESELFDLACRIWDNPECRGKEFFAADILTKALEKEGFAVEMGIGGQETGFRAVWKNGEGGPNFGLLGEYDALEGLGHGCGHHLQTPAAIGAAVAVKKLFEGTQYPVTVTVYGTPAEETYGGKIIMAKNGCFQELDAVLASHATRGDAFVGGSSMALSSIRAIFKGKSAHAASTPWAGRSAADAMLLSFNGVEHMREHVKDGTRMHYTVRESLGPSNVVPDRAVGGYTLRSRDNAYLKELEAWLRDIIKGACLMTQTEAEIVDFPQFAARKQNVALAQLAKENFDQLGIAVRDQLIQDSGCSTDFGNVSCIVPGALVYLHYISQPGHSPDWVDAGKSEAAKKCMMDSARVMAGMLYDMICDGQILDRAKTEFAETEL